MFFILHVIEDKGNLFRMQRLDSADFSVYFDIFRFFATLKVFFDSIAWLQEQGLPIPREISRFDKSFCELADS